MQSPCFIKVKTDQGKEPVITKETTLKAKPPLDNYTKLMIPVGTYDRENLSLFEVFGKRSKSKLIVHAIDNMDSHLVSKKEDRKYELWGPIFASKISPCFKKAVGLNLTDQKGKAHSKWCLCLTRVRPWPLAIPYPKVQLVSDMLDITS